MNMPVCRQLRYIDAAKKEDAKASSFNIYDGNSDII